MDAAAASDGVLQAVLAARPPEIAVTIDARPPQLKAGTSHHLPDGEMTSARAERTAENIVELRASTP